MAVTDNGRVIIFGAAADAITTTVYINKIRWVGPSTAAHIMKLTNTADKELVTAVANVDKNDQDINFPREGIAFAGVKVATLGSGTVYMYRS